MLGLKGRGLAATQDNIEPETKSPFGLGDLQIESRDQPLSGLFIGYRLKNRVMCQQRVARKIHLCDQAGRECASEQRKMNVGRSPGIVVVIPWVRAGFDRHKLIAAVGIGQGSSRPCEIWIERGEVFVLFMAITSGSIGLPDFQQGVRNWPATITEHASRHNHAFAEWFTRVLPSEIAIRFGDVIMPIHRAGCLGKSMGQNDQRFAWSAQNRCAIRRVERDRLAVWVVTPVGSDVDCLLHPSVFVLLNHTLLHHAQSSVGRFKSAKRRPT